MRRLPILLLIPGILFACAPPQADDALPDDMAAMGFQEAELVPPSGHPGVWGYYDAGADKTLMVYLMYDVQPVNPEDWESPPFEANLVDHELGRVLMARGATNQKGPERALFNAIESILAAEGTLPVNLMVTAEGEEELGSPHYPEIVDQYEERLRAAEGRALAGGERSLLPVHGATGASLRHGGIGAWNGGSRTQRIHGDPSRGGFGDRRTG